MYKLGQGGGDLRLDFEGDLLLDRLSRELPRRDLESRRDLDFSRDRLRRERFASFPSRPPLSISRDRSRDLHCRPHEVRKRGAGGSIGLEG